MIRDLNPHCEKIAHRAGNRRLNCAGEIRYHNRLRSAERWARDAAGERCWSGRTGLPAKQLHWQNRCRGFESPPLRHPHRGHTRGCRCSPDLPTTAHACWPTVPAALYRVPARSSCFLAPEASPMTAGPALGGLQSMPSNGLPGKKIRIRFRPSRSAGRRWSLGGSPEPEVALDPRYSHALPAKPEAFVLTETDWSFILVI
jgi:hypothetical protein